MARTPDRTPGVSDEEGIVFSDEGVDPSNVGEIRNNGGSLKGMDSVGVFDLRSGGGISEAQHEALDTLLHGLVEGNFEEFTYSGFRVTNITIWTDVGKTLKIREEQFTYTGFRVATQTIIQYDGAGVPVMTMTGTFTYSGFQPANVTWVRT